MSFCSHRNIAILFAIPLTFLYIPACLTHAFPLTKFEDFECLWYFLPWDQECIDAKCSSSVVQDKKAKRKLISRFILSCSHRKVFWSIQSHSVTYNVNYIWHLIKIKINIAPCYLSLYDYFFVKYSRFFITSRLTLINSSPQLNTWGVESLAQS